MLTHDPVNDKHKLPQQLSPIHTAHIYIHTITDSLQWYATYYNYIHICFSKLYS